MLTILLILFLFLLVPDIYIFRMHVLRGASKAWLRLGYWLPTVAIMAGFACYLSLGDENLLANHARGIGRLAVAAILFSIPKILFMLCSLSGLLVHSLIKRVPRAAFSIAGGMLGVLCFGGILYGATEGIRRFEVKEAEYRSARLPEGFEGYRIVQISDAHIGSWQEDTAAVARMVELVNRQQAGLIVFTGDLVNQRAIELDGFEPILSRLHAPDGVFSILGNHDYGTYYRWSNAEEERRNLASLKERQKEMGWTLLDNEHRILHRKGDSIALIGVENDGEPPFSQHADLPRAMEGTEGLFSILLSHNPTHWRREVLKTSAIDLMLAGHTHAFQMELFGYSPSAWMYPEWAGMYHEGDKALYVNVGVGHVGLPFRFGAWPEITVLTLRRQTGSAAKGINAGR